MDRETKIYEEIWALGDKHKITTNVWELRPYKLWEIRDEKVNKKTILVKYRHAHGYWEEV